MKKIWLICLCLASLGLAGCFHIPDEDWLPSRNKVKTEDVEKGVEFEQAVDSFMDWINMISSDWNEIKNDDENDEVNNETSEGLSETENEEISYENNIASEEITDNESENQEIEEIIPEE